jgi:hypothetical protein
MVVLVEFWGREQSSFFCDWLLCCILLDKEVRI